MSQGPLDRVRGALKTCPLLQQDLIGNVAIGPTNRSRGFVFGKAPVVNNVVVDLWTGPTTTYVFPTVGQQMRVVSDSANDSSTGTGVQKIHIHYLDSSYTIRNEVITLNGLTPVNTVATNIYRINAMHAEQVGTVGVSAGNISLTNTAGTITYGHIVAGFNSARQSIYTVPVGVTGYINHWQASSGSAGNHFCQTTLRATCHDGVLFPGVFLIQDEVGTQNGGLEITFPTPVPIPAGTDVKISAISDSNAANVIALGAIMGWFETL